MEVAWRRLSCWWVGEVGLAGQFMAGNSPKALPGDPESIKALMRTICIKAQQHPEAARVPTKIVRDEATRVLLMAGDCPAAARGRLPDFTTFGLNPAAPLGSDQEKASFVLKFREKCTGACGALPATGCGGAPASPKSARAGPASACRGLLRARAGAGHHQSQAAVARTTWHNLVLSWRRKARVRGDAVGLPAATPARRLGDDRVPSSARRLPGFSHASCAADTLCHPPAPSSTINPPHCTSLQAHTCSKCAPGGRSCAIRTASAGAIESRAARAPSGRCLPSRGWTTSASSTSFGSRTSRSLADSLLSCT